MFAGTPSAILRDARRAVDDHTVATPCGGCNACCRADFPVPLTDDEAARLPAMFDDIIGKPVLQRVGRRCVMLDDAGLCTIYNDRPLSCRTYDCRQTFIAGLRNRGKGEEINERLDQWRTRFDNDQDGAICLMLFDCGRKAIEAGHDVGTAVAIGLGLAFSTSRQQLRAIGRRYVHKARECLATLNHDKPSESK